MTSIVDGSVKIQTASESHFSTPSWFGEVVVISSYLHKHGVLSKINEHVALRESGLDAMKVRHEVVPMSVSTTNVVMRPAVSPAASYQDMRSR